MVIVDDQSIRTFPDTVLITGAINRARFVVHIKKVKLWYLRKKVSYNSICRPSGPIKILLHSSNSNALQRLVHGMTYNTYQLVAQELSQCKQTFPSSFTLRIVVVVTAQGKGLMAINEPNPILQPEDKVCLRCHTEEFMAHNFSFTPEGRKISQLHPTCLYTKCIVGGISYYHILILQSRACVRESGRSQEVI